VAAKPMTWAAMASRNTGSGGTGQSTTSTVGSSSSNMAVGQQQQTAPVTDVANQLTKTATAAWYECRLFGSDLIAWA